MSCDGPYTVSRKRKDGTLSFSQMFNVNTRPKGFPATFKIYAQDKPGPLTHQESELILERSMTNYREFLAMQDAQRVEKPRLKADLPKKGWSRLAALARDSYWFDGLSCHSRALYGRDYEKLAAALDGNPEMDPSVITQGQIEQFLRRRGYSSNTAIRWGVVFNQLLRIAATEGIRPNHHPIRLRVTRTEPLPVRIWEQSDVDTVTQVFEAKGDMVTSELVQLAFATGLRMGDIRQLRFDKDYRDGGIVHILTNKTNRPIFLTMPPALRRRLDARHQPGQVLFPSPQGNGKAFTISQLSHYFRKSMAHVMGYEDVPLKLRCLRHSAILNFARAGCTIPMIASVTGHSLVTVHQILSHYLPRDPMLAAQAQAMRAEADNVFAMNPVIEGSARTLIDGRALPQKPTAEPPRPSA